MARNAQKFIGCGCLHRGYVPLVASLVLLGSLAATMVAGFTMAPQVNSFLPGSKITNPQQIANTPFSASATSSTALNVWWFGGSPDIESNQDSDSCELVAVRIERTSANSRKIAGDITVPTPMEDVWAILSDYDRLATHVPNLVESRVVSRPSRGEPGDGSYRCKLFQKGAQTIVGFEFGASLTMEMTEQVLAATEANQERKIGFRCVDSFFFSGFDGEWRAKEQIGPNGEIETILNYVVDVRPKGPVPVAALEWRIREDVPTNLRAVKKAAVEVGQEGVLAYRSQQGGRAAPARIDAPALAAQSESTARPRTVADVNGKAAPAQTNAIKRATVRRRNGITKDTLKVAARNSADALSKTNGRTNRVIPQPLPIRNNDQAARNGAKVANVNNANSNGRPQETNTRPLPVKVNWDTDETMAAYLRRE